MVGVARVATSDNPGQEAARVLERPSTRALYSSARPREMVAEEIGKLTAGLGRIRFKTGRSLMQLAKKA